MTPRSLELEKISHLRHSNYQIPTARCDSMKGAIDVTDEWFFFRTSWGNIPEALVFLMSRSVCLLLCVETSWSVCACGVLSVEVWLCDCAMVSYVLAADLQITPSPPCSQRVFSVFGRWNHTESDGTSSLVICKSKMDEKDSNHFIHYLCTLNLRRTQQRF